MEGTVILYYSPLFGNPLDGLTGCAPPRAVVGVFRFRQGAAR
jgi:hypothetical protein